MAKMEVVFRKTEELIPYEKNPRNNDEAVASVKESFTEFGIRDPFIITSDNVIVAGHTRLKAAKELGIEEIPCVVVGDMTEEQIRAFRLVHNKTAEIATWDEELLQEELQQIFDLDMSLFGFGEDEDEEGEPIQDDTYTMKSNIPQYEITGECPELTECLDEEKTQELIEEIEKADGITENERRFLKLAAGRHNVFNYRNIAEYYAHATPQMQRLMEKSALVIIDIDNAIANGYASLFGDVLDIMEGEDDEG
ncbi:MAG: ParB N-terminal domain-containing protein [Eubacteriales bacterium]|nr:ParB N-terminal domain-containing protein [Eubacteriales bacterium]